MKCLQQSRLAVSLLLGGLIGAALVYLHIIWAVGFRTTDEMATWLGVHSLGGIPKIRLRRRGDLMNYLRTETVSPMAEANRNARTTIMMSLPKEELQTIMITSSLQGEGKTTQSVSLARNFAGLGGRTLLVEGDLRRHTLTSYFPDSDHSKGFMEALHSPDRPVEAFVHKSPEDSLDVLLCPVKI